MIRRLLPLAGVLLCLIPRTTANANGLPDPYADCWWHINHYHCGNEIVFPKPDTDPLQGITTTTSTTVEPTTTTDATTTTAPTTTAPPQPTTTETTSAPINTAQATTSTQVTTSTTVPQATTTLALPTTSTVRPQPSTTATPTPLRPIATTPAANPTTTTTLQETSTTTLAPIDEAVANLTEQQITPELIAQIQNADENTRRQYEATINIYGGNAESYIPVGSRVPVRTRRLIIITTGLLVASPLRRKAK